MTSLTYIIYKELAIYVGIVKYTCSIDTQYIQNVIHIHPNILIRCHHIGRPVRTGNTEYSIIPRNWQEILKQRAE